MALNRRTLFVAKGAAVLSAVPLMVYAFSTGPLPKKTGVPGEGICAECHAGTAVNGGGGKVEIAFPSGLSYSPGVTQRLTVTITDASASVYGFQLTARLESDIANGQAGDLSPLPGDSVFVICADGSPKAAAGCPASASVQFIEHNAPHTANTFQVDWTPPGSDRGPVHVYVAANAANGDHTPRGDHIYTANYTLTSVGAQSGGPQLASARGAVSAASFLETVAPGSWVTLAGSNLASRTRLWEAPDFAEDKLPMALDGTSVTIGGKPAAVGYISPTVVNVLAPDDIGPGPVEVQLTTPQGTTKTTAQVQAFAPALFMHFPPNPADNGKYPAAQHLDFSTLGKVGLFGNAPSTPAKPGEVIVLYGTGFGGANPPVSADRLVLSPAPLANQVTVTIGNLPATVVFAGMIQAGLCQLNVQVPDGVPDGDNPLSVQVNGQRTQDLFLSVQK